MSSLWWQLCIPSPKWVQLLIFPSFPLHLTSSNKIIFDLSPSSNLPVYYAFCLGKYEYFLHHIQISLFLEWINFPKISKVIVNAVQLSKYLHIPWFSQWTTNNFRSISIKWIITHSTTNIINSNLYTTRSWISSNKTSAYIYI